MHKCPKIGRWERTQGGKRLKRRLYNYFVNKQRELNIFYSSPLCRVANRVVVRQNRVITLAYIA